jgi:hypothetical protein
MRAGENRKFHNNMQYEQSARRIGIAGFALFSALGPLGILVLAIGFLTVLTGHNGHAGQLVMAAAAPIVVVPRDFLQVMEEAEGTVLKDTYQRMPGIKEKAAKLLGLIYNESRMATHKRAYLMKEAESTSDFPILFGYIIDRQLLAKYSVAAPDYKNYVKTGTQIDFKPADAIGIYGLQSQLGEVKQRGEYKNDASLADGKVSITLKKYGRVFGLAWESLINDDLGALSDIPERLATAALRTEWKNATALIASAAGPNTALFGAPIVHPIDGKNVTNLVTGAGSAFSITTLAAAAAAMRRQLDADLEPIMIEGFELVVPPALEVAMLQALNPANLIMSGGDSTINKAAIIRTSANVVANMNITGHVNPYLPIIDTTSGSTAWYLFAKLSSGYAVKLNFLRGHETPEVCMKNPNKVSMGGGAINPLEGSFEDDSVNWRVRHILGGAAVDPRFAVAYAGV